MQGEVNNLLQAGLKAHLAYKKQGRKELATAILRLTSSYASLMIALDKIKFNSY